MAIKATPLDEETYLLKHIFLFRQKNYRYRTFRLSAFSLIELLVVIAIISMLISFLLPAIQRTREAARRIACVNNLHQLELGIEQFESDHGVLPASGIVNISNQVFYAQSGKMFSWVILILPFIEQRGLYDHFNFSKTIFDQSSDPQATQISTLICPSDSAQGQYFVHSKLTLNKPFAKGNYAAFVSPYHIELQMKYPGALIGNGQHKEMVIDGLSHTLMLSEVRVRKHQQDQRGAWALPWNGSSLLAFDMHCAPKVGSGSKFEANKSSLGLTQLPNNRGPNVDVLYSCPDIIGSQMEKMPCGLWNPTGEFNYLSSAPRSNHPGGVNVVFMDGHAGFLLDNIDENTMAYLISINDGHLVSDSEYVQ
jgi:prepilin-type N-terminal cleavage/methylation domain-containing protein/prepilin-type processing-associated H-X9-DG protein